jgi:hypothetical protein
MVKERYKGCEAAGILHLHIGTTSRLCFIACGFYGFGVYPRERRVAVSVSENVLSAPKHKLVVKNSKEYTSKNVVWPVKCCLATDGDKVNSGNSTHLLSVLIACMKH